MVGWREAVVKGTPKPVPPKKQYPNVQRQSTGDQQYENALTFMSSFWISQKPLTGCVGHWTRRNFQTDPTGLFNVLDPWWVQTSCLLLKGRITLLLSIYYTDRSCSTNSSASHIGRLIFLSFSLCHCKQILVSALDLAEPQSHIEDQLMLIK